MYLGEVHSSLGICSYLLLRKYLRMPYISDNNFSLAIGRVMFTTIRVYTSMTERAKFAFMLVTPHYQAIVGTYAKISPIPIADYHGPLSLASSTSCRRFAHRIWVQARCKLSCAPTESGRSASRSSPLATNNLQSITKAKSLFL